MLQARRFHGNGFLITRQLTWSLRSLWAPGDLRPLPVVRRTVSPTNGCGDDFQRQKRYLKLYPTEARLAKVWLLWVPGGWLM